MTADQHDIETLVFPYVGAKNGRINDSNFYLCEETFGERQSKTNVLQMHLT